MNSIETLNLRASGLVEDQVCSGLNRTVESINCFDLELRILNKDGYLIGFCFVSNSNLREKFVIGFSEDLERGSKVSKF